jgi:hypothetical protein
MLAGSRVLNRSGGSMMWQSPETRNSLYVAIGGLSFGRLPGYQIVGLPCINIVATTGAGQRLMPVTAGVLSVTGDAGRRRRAGAL